MKCKKCGYELEENMVFCTQCGAEQKDKQTISCSNCGELLKDGVFFCSKCGMKVDIEKKTIDDATCNDEIKKKKNTNRIFSFLQNNRGYKKPILLLLFSAVLSVLTSVASLIMYEKVYIFKAGTLFGWILTLLLAVVGIILVAKNIKCKTNIRKRHIITLFFAILIGISNLAFSFAVNSVYDKSKTTIDSSYSLSSSRKESLAEDAAMMEIISYMQSNREFNRYNIYATKYKVGSITHEDDDYTVKGTLYLYDDYGNLKDTAIFSCVITVDNNGLTSAKYYPSIHIN